MSENQDATDSGAWDRLGTTLPIVPKGPGKEAPASPEDNYSLEDEEEFLDFEEMTLGQRVEDLAGRGMILTGTALTVVAVADFISGGRVSEALASVGPENVPQIISEALLRYAELPSYLKSGGAFSITGLGMVLEHKARRK